MTIDPRYFIKGDTKRVTILDTATASDAAVFDTEYAFFKITPLAVTGIPAATTITLLMNDKIVLVNDGTIQMTYPDRDFVWAVTPMTGMNNISLELGAAASADIIFQITGYESIGK